MQALKELKIRLSVENGGDRNAHSRHDAQKVPRFEIFCDWADRQGQKPIRMVV